jgi:hypothetical protein
MQNPFTPARAARHATLSTRLTALLRQVEIVAKTRPGEPASLAMLRLAEDLLFEAREFRLRGERRGLPAVAPDHAGLAVQLGQALAMLDVWQRHAQPAAVRDDDGYSDAEVADMRDKLARRLDQLVGIRLRGTQHAQYLPSNQQLDEVYPRAVAPE